MKGFRLRIGKNIRWGIVVTAGLLVGVCAYLYQALPGSPEEALRKFHSEKVAEDQIIDPLILAGKEVVPLLLKEMKDRNLERRRYAIAALGHLGDLSALATLKDIFKDDSEIDYYRCDALEAMALLDPNVGRALANEQTASSVSCLSQISQSLVAGKLPNRRTYLQALLRWHQ